MKKWQGSKWIRRSRRQRIYERDGRRCVYCGSTCRLTLDHLRPRLKEGVNATSNLVTACISCNSARGSRSVRGFCIDVALYLGQDWRTIIARVRSAQRRLA